MCLYIGRFRVIPDKLQFYGVLAVILLKPLGRGAK